MSPCRTLEGLNGKMCELLHTSAVVQKMHVVGKGGLYYRPIVAGDPVTTNPSLAPASLSGLFPFRIPHIVCPGFPGPITGFLPWIEEAQETPKPPPPSTGSAYQFAPDPISEKSNQRRHQRAQQQAKHEKHDETHDVHASVA